MRKLVLTALAVLMMLTSCAVFQRNEATVSVSGTGVVVLKADMVSFYVGVSESAATTGEAQQAANAKISAIMAILRANGIKDEDMSTTSLNFSSEYTWDNGYREKVAEVVGQSVYVKMRNLDGFAALVDALGAGVSGITFDSVSFDSTDRAEAIRKARELAYQDAYGKASLYAAQADMEVDRLSSINDGYSSYSTGYGNSYAKMAMAEAAVSDAYYSTEAPVGQLTVSCEVEACFIIK